MLESPLTRLFTIIVLLGALLGLFVWFGSLDPSPEQHAYPSEDDLAAGYDAYVGEDVSVSGKVVETDPVVLQVDHETGTTEYRLENAPDTERGQHVTAFVRVQPDGVLKVQNTIVRDPWERIYMYVISMIAALWVLSRMLRQWQLDPTQGIVPRAQPVTLANVLSSARGERDA